MRRHLQVALLLLFCVDHACAEKRQQQQPTDRPRQSQKEEEEDDGDDASCLAETAAVPITTESCVVECPSRNTTSAEAHHDAQDEKGPIQDGKSHNVSDGDYHSKYANLHNDSTRNYPSFVANQEIWRICELWQETTGQRCTSEQQRLLEGRSSRFRLAEKNADGSASDLPNDIEWLSSLFHCMQDGLTNVTAASSTQQQDAIPFVENEFPTWETLEEGNPYAHPIAVQINNAVSSHDAQRLLTLQQCIHQHHPHMIETRGSGHRGIAGNTCTHTAGLLQWMLPEVAQRVRTLGQLAYDHARWNDYNPQRYGHDNDFFRVGYRTAELLEYSSSSGGLALHEDSLSLYTVLIMLSPPEEYEGGEFLSSIFRKSYNGAPRVPQSQHLVDREAGIWQLTVPQYSAMVFLADENMHKVLPITHGTRRSFANEFWELGDAPAGIMRPDPAMYRHFEEHGEFEVNSWREKQKAKRQ